MADHDGPLQPHPRGDEPELPVAVGGLIEVHEIHVDRGPGDLAIELRVEVQERLLEGREPADPHLGRREGVHPGDQPDAGIAGVGLLAEALDLVRTGQDGLDHHLDRDVARGIKAGRDPQRMLGDGLERVGAVQMLRSGDEPDLVGADIEHAAVSWTYWPYWVV